MKPETPEPPPESGLIVRLESGLAILPSAGTSAMAEMISRSLAHIQTSKALAVPQRRAGEEWEFEIAPGVKMVMCWIPPGEFLMGSPEDEKGRCKNETQHRVEITQGFWLAKTPTTQAQWHAVMGSNPSWFKGEDFPVENVTWNDICGNESASGGFLGKLNMRLPVRGRYYLPTEAQWEYACRAGTTGAYAGNLDEMGWSCDDDYDPCDNGDDPCDNGDVPTHPVGQKKPNAWGLHDMHGSLWEWCADWYGDYPKGAATDPTGPKTGSSRVVRGGSWVNSGILCRSAFRKGYTPDSRHVDSGCRVARSSVP